MESTFFEKKEHSVNKANFGFKSNFTPPQHELLSPFESDLYDMIRSINFKPVRNGFQKKLTDDINNIKRLKTCSFLLTRSQTYMKNT